MQGKAKAWTLALPAGLANNLQWLVVMKGVAPHLLVLSTAYLAETLRRQRAVVIVSRNNLYARRSVSLSRDVCQYTRINTDWQGNPMTPQAQSAHLSGNPLKDYLRLAVILGALLHDLGKGTIGFQRRLWHALKGTTVDGKDPLRHELISVLLINLKSPEGLWLAAREGTLCEWFEARCEALRSDESIRQAQDWIRDCRTLRHSQGGEGEAAYLHRFNQQLTFNQTQAWSEHPFWMSVLWLVYTHHKLFKGRWQAQTGAFTLTPESHLDANAYDEDDVLHADAEQRVPDYLSLQPTGQPWHSEQWCQAFCNAVACLDDLRSAYPGYEQTLFLSLPDQQKGLGQSTTWIKSLTRLGRLSLVLGDYEASCDAVKGSTINPMPGELYANTKHQGESLLMGDTLPNHLLKASHWAMTVFDGLLSNSSTRLLYPGRIDHQDAPCAVTQLQLSSDSAYYWQSEVQQAAKALQDSDCGAFVVVAAGTGRGKTKGCATFMANARRLARFSVLLSMRSLTFQTAKAYLHETIGYHPDAVYEMGSGMPAYPSQEMDVGEKKEGDLSRKLYRIKANGQENQAAFHDVKLGNALRTIDIWHGHELFDATPIEPLGVVSTHMVSLRLEAKRDFYSLVKANLFDWVNQFKANTPLSQISNLDDLCFVMAVLIRGGAFV